MQAKKKRRLAVAPIEPGESATPLPAGGFSAWLRLTRLAQDLKTIGAEVPCGECNACCRASYFIHIGPNEAETLDRVPRALLFPAPGLPKGNLLMGYNAKGECPMWTGSRCSIYEHRPQTCRDFDCRILSATGIALDPNGPQALIAQRVKRWKFEYPNEQDCKEHAAVRAAADFLQEHRSYFPPNVLPNNPIQLAVLAIRLCDVFFQLNETASSAGEMLPETEIARAVMDAIRDGGG